MFTNNLVLEVINNALYDYRFGVIEIKAETWDFFSVPVGMTGPYGSHYPSLQSRTLFETNMFDCERLPYVFLAKGLRFYSNAKGKDRDALLEHGRIEFIIRNRIYAEVAPLGRAPALFDVFPFAFPALDTLSDPYLFLLQYQKAVESCLFSFIPLQIEKGKPFRVKVSFEKEIKFSRPVTLGVIIDGTPMREVY